MCHFFFILVDNQFISNIRSQLSLIEEGIGFIVRLVSFKECLYKILLKTTNFIKYGFLFKTLIEQGGLIIKITIL